MQVQCPQILHHLGLAFLLTHPVQWARCKNTLKREAMQGAIETAILKDFFKILNLGIEKSKDLKN
jgi:hypothetical protein